MMMKFLEMCTCIKQEKKKKQNKNEKMKEKKQNEKQNTLNKQLAGRARPPAQLYEPPL